jgi:hypothetical protein
MCFRNAVGALTLLACICLSLPADDAKLKSLPPGVLKALAGAETDYCDQFLGDYKKGCHETFRANLSWTQLKLTPSGQEGILVESMNMGECGSAGCDLFLFVLQPDGKFVQVLGLHGDTGTLERIKVLESITRSHYDIQKTWADGKTHTMYQWNGRRYSAR